MKLYAKSLLYVLLAIAGVLVTALTDNVVTISELVNIAIIGVGAVGVYVTPNAPEGVARFLKTGVAFTAAALVALSSFLTDGITAAEWMQIAIAAFAGIGVYIIPNENSGAALRRQIDADSKAAQAVIETYTRGRRVQAEWTKTAKGDL